MVTFLEYVKGILRGKGIGPSLWKDIETENFSELNILEKKILFIMIRWQIAKKYV
jgi:hypothetical protein